MFFYRNTQIGIYIYKYASQNSRFVTSNHISEAEYDQINAIRANILGHNKEAREKYSAQHGIDPSTYEIDSGGINYVTLPNSIYTGYDDTDFSYNDNDDIDFFNTNNSYDRSKVLQGNLAGIFDKL